ncbi:ATP-binding cassette domain-containing protein [Luedemannella helvata]|uniref:ATP-binding cassette domain-containing protein n=1 Tax=Luedemannella helvata TaxID=349315 RepID=A0ABP4VZ88_9ACTN
MIETVGLRKSYRDRKRRETTTVDAVRGVDLSVAEGEIFGFLGPNGAGKTTTLRMLATLLAPDGGTATIAGADLLRDPGEVRRRIGYVAQGGGTWDEATAEEELILQARFYGASKVEAGKAAAAAIESFDLGDFAQRPCKTYSGGQRRRLDVALGIIHAPKLVFLDEPTTGLDPQSRANMWDEIRRLRAEGLTVFLTTHYLDEADALCDRVAIIDQGQIVAEGTPAALKREISGDAVIVGLAGSDEATGTGIAEKAASLLASQPYVLSSDIRDDGALRLYVDSGETAIPALMRELAGAGMELSTIELHRPTLDDVFLAKTGKSLRD